MASPSPQKRDAASVNSPLDALHDINLTRAWWILIITTIFTVFFTISGRITGTSQAFSAVQIVDYTGSMIALALFILARWVGRPVILRRILPSIYAVFFVLINDGYYFSAWPVAGDNVGYAFGVLTPAALLYLRPKVFVPFLIANHLVVCALILQKQAPFEALVSAIYGTTITMAIAVISSIIQYRTKVAELEKTALVARRNEELSAANSSLLAMSQSMDETMSLAAHDLRGPLLSLASLCELEKGRPGWTGPDQATFLSAVRESADGMASVVSRMIADYAARGDSLQGLVLLRCDLAEIFQKVARRVEPSARRKGIALEVRDFPAAAWAEANREALERIFGNLISNAIKFSPTGAAINLRVKRVGADWACEVEDNGPGILPEDRPMLFDKLRQGTNRPTAGEESSGLGLFSARKLAESMQGRLEFEPAPERGSIFRLLLEAAA